MFQPRSKSRDAAVPKQDQRADDSGSGKTPARPSLWIRAITDTPVIQPRLTINAPGDRYEREADRVADRVMRQVVPEEEDQPIQAYPQAGPITPLVQRQVDPEEEEEEEPVQAERLVQRQVEEEEEEEPVQAKGETGGARPLASGVAAQVNALRGGGRPLPEGTRAFFEPRFGHDFSDVRVHTGPAAAGTAMAMKARAYTVGRDVVFGAGEYAPETRTGQKLIAHELTHVIQQRSAPPSVQRTYRLNELLTPRRTARHSNPIPRQPRSYFYPGSATNTTNRRAVVIGGIHGSERSAWQLRQHINSQLGSGTQPDFHTIVVPRANPTGTRGAGHRAQQVRDLNREYETGYTSPNPLAQEIKTIITEFAPERILSIHAVGNPALAGIYLDPIHTGRYPAIGTASQRRAAFTGDPRNLAAMQLTEAMIGQVRTDAAGRRYTRGNVPGTKGIRVRGRTRRLSFPASQYPSPPGGRSQYSLIYPQQSQVSRTLGMWASGQGRTIITIEIPGWRAPRRIWNRFAPAVLRFLRMSTGGSASQPATSSSASQPATSGSASQPATGVQRAPITSADLRRQRNADLDRFMRRVYDLQVQLWTSQGVQYVGGVAAADLARLPARDKMPSKPSIQIHRAVLNPLRNLLAAARNALTAARRTRQPGTSRVTDVRVRSGYRSARQQLQIWERWYPTYYRRTRRHRRGLSGGEHGEAAARYLAAYINQRVFSPGYSTHQHGLAVDLTYLRSGVWAEAETSGVWMTRWTRSWLYRWLLSNAAGYGFVQNPMINEPWHWEYRPDRVLAALVEAFLQLLRYLLQRALSALRSLFGLANQ